MDSLTQIVLGAACGEAVAGKKIGNRALLWGAFGGTIPDLDVLSSFLTDEMTALAFHRGFMHSILFACLFPWVMAWLAHRLYGREIYRSAHYKKTAYGLLILVLLGVGAGINRIPLMMGNSLNYMLLGATIAISLAILWALWKFWVSRDQEQVNGSYTLWVQVFFWSIFTHPILDAFTGYGTQLFAPFSDYRVQWDTVSIVDPMYTVPFGLCLIVLSFLHRQNKWRSLINWAGIAWSCMYLAFTVSHKVKVNEIFAQSLKTQNINYQRFTTGPTIFNNTLWKGTVEADSCFYFGMYGFNDKQEAVQKFERLPKNQDWVNESNMVPRDLRILRWFSNGYYNVVADSDGKLIFNDLRFGLTSEDYRGLESYIFSWNLVPDEKQGGILSARQLQEPRGDPDKMLTELRQRIQGK
jgi:inner membrane protein